MTYPCYNHRFPRDPSDVHIMSTYADGAEIQYTCPRCDETVVAEVLTADLRVLPEGRDGGEVRA